MGPLGIQEMLIIGVVALLIFGPKKLPELGSGLGKAIQNFKDGLKDKGDDGHKREKQEP